MISKRIPSVIQLYNSVKFLYTGSDSHKHTIYYKSTY